MESLKYQFAYLHLCSVWIILSFMSCESRQESTVNQDVTQFPDLLQYKVNSGSDCYGPTGFIHLGQCKPVSDHQIMVLSYVHMHVTNLSGICDEFTDTKLNNYIPSQARLCSGERECVVGPIDWRRVDAGGYSNILVVFYTCTEEKETISVTEHSYTQHKLSRGTIKSRRYPHNDSFTSNTSCVLSSNQPIDLWIVEVDFATPGKFCITSESGVPHCTNSAQMTFTRWNDTHLPVPFVSRDNIAIQLKIDKESGTTGRFALLFKGSKSSLVSVTCGNASNIGTSASDNTTITTERTGQSTSVAYSHMTDNGVSQSSTVTTTTNTAKSHLTTLTSQQTSRQLTTSVSSLTTDDVPQWQSTTGNHETSPLTTSTTKQTSELKLSSLTTDDVSSRQLTTGNHETSPHSTLTTKQTSELELLSLTTDDVTSPQSTIGNHETLLLKTSTTRQTSGLVLSSLTTDDVTARQTTGNQEKSFLTTLTSRQTSKIALYSLTTDDYTPRQTTRRLETYLLTTLTTRQTSGLTISSLTTDDVTPRQSTTDNHETFSLKTPTTKQTSELEPSRFTTDDVTARQSTTGNHETSLLTTLTTRWIASSIFGMTTGEVSQEQTTTASLETSHLTTMTTKQTSNPTTNDQGEKRESIGVPVLAGSIGAGVGILLVLVLTVAYVICRRRHHSGEDGTTLSVNPVYERASPTFTSTDPFQSYIVVNSPSSEQKNKFPVGQKYNWQ